MRKLHYASGDLLMADQTCNALMRYARALAERGAADVVAVPMVTPVGEHSVAHLLVGPSSQLMSTPVENPLPEPDDAETVAELERLIRGLEPSSAVHSDGDPEASDLALSLELDF